MVDSPPEDSPLRVTAELTRTLEILAEGGVRFWDATALPIGAATAGVAVSALELLKATIQGVRLENLMKVGRWVKQLRKEQNVTATPVLPTKVQMHMIEGASCEDDDRMQRRWAQLLVNAQAGLRLDAYLFEILGKLCSDDVDVLRRIHERELAYQAAAENYRAERKRLEGIFYSAARTPGGKNPEAQAAASALHGLKFPDSPRLDEYDEITDKLHSLGLLLHHEEVVVGIERVRDAGPRNPDDVNLRASAEQEPKGYTLSSLGKRFYLAATEPVATPS